MSLLTNPLALRMALIFFGIAFSFVIAVLLMRRLRRSLTTESSFAADTPAPANSPLYAVIQQLKQQKHELQTERQAERRRAKTSENISAAVLSNLSSGVMFLTSDGIVHQANAAARQILGFASPIGVTAAQVFREASLLTTSGQGKQKIAEIIQRSLRDTALFLQMDAHYVTPAGEARTLDITLTAVRAPEGEVLGAACLLNDQSEVAGIRQQQKLRGEISSEMALDLHNSVNAISGYARRLNASSDPELARQLAGDIVEEAARLDSTIGGFLSGAGTAASAGSGI
jgi:nitrogen fixation/metabolism regulation signal transduction histidine kinase